MKSDASPVGDALFLRLPAEYAAYARRWCSYHKWSVEEAANLLAGCVPTRELFLRGQAHRDLDDEIVAIENRLRSALGNQLTPISRKKYFDDTWVSAAEVMAWAAAEGMDIPEALAAAWQDSQATGTYRTPAMAALAWVVDRYWEHCDPRDAPTQGEIVAALLQAFPELSVEECEMVEHIARHPASRSSGP